MKNFITNNQCIIIYCLQKLSFGCPGCPPPWPPKYCGKNRIALRWRQARSCSLPWRKPVPSSSRQGHDSQGKDYPLSRQSSCLPISKARDIWGPAMNWSAWSLSIENKSSYGNFRILRVYRIYRYRAFSHRRYRRATGRRDDRYLVWQRPDRHDRHCRWVAGFCRGFPPKCNGCSPKKSRVAVVVFALARVVAVVVLAPVRVVARTVA